MLSTGAIDTLLPNEFNVLRYKWRDTHRVKLRIELVSSNHHNLGSKKELLTVDFALIRILEFLTAMSKMEFIRSTGRPKEITLATEQALLTT